MLSMLISTHKGTTKINMSSVLNYLQFQPIDADSDDISDNHRAGDEIDLEEQVDEESLGLFWDDVLNDIHSGSGINYSDN